MENLIGKRYIDPEDSGELVMEILAVDSLSPNGWMIVKPVGLDRCWQRPPSVLAPLVAAYEASNSSVSGALTWRPPATS